MRILSEIPEVTDEQRAATELLKRIRKLRWMGMEQEAHRMVRSSLRVCVNEARLREPFGRTYPASLT